jgi:hypothetical protein
MPAVVEALTSGDELPVEPGKEAVARFSVRNTGDDVNNFTFRILGEAGGWTAIRVVGDLGGERKPGDGPPELDLLPNGRGEVEVTFRPPQSSKTGAGLVPFGLLVCSNVALEDKREEVPEAVEEGVLHVGKFAERKAQLLPRTSRGRFSGKHRLAVDNYGNSTETAIFDSEDAENILDARFSPKLLVIGAGTVGFTKVKLKPRRKFLLGPPRAVPFKLKIKFGSDVAAAKAVPETEALLVDGLYMQRSILPTVLLPIAALVAAGVILWAIFKPQANATGPQLSGAQAAARSVALARTANALTLRAITTAQGDAQKARNQSARQFTAARKQAEKTQTKAANATKTATKAGTKAAAATTAAAKALQLATPPFSGTPYGQQLALPANCTHGCASPQPFTAQPFPAQTFYVTDVVVGNTGSGEGTLTLTLGGQPVLVEPLGRSSNTDLKLSTPLLVQGDSSLAVRISCAKGPCTASVFVSGHYPAKPPDPSGADGIPRSARLTRTCQPASACAVMTVPADASSYELTDVIFQNPAGDKGTVTLSRGEQPLLVEGLDPAQGDVPISLAAPILLKAGEKLDLTVDCRNSGGKACTPGALLVGVLRVAAAPQKP